MIIPSVVDFAAGTAAGAPVTVSVAHPLAPAVAGILTAAGAAYVIENAEAWGQTLRGEAAPARVRLIGGSRAAFADASHGRVDVALYSQPVVESGRIELLTFLHEQAVAVTAHRFGSSTPVAEGLFG